jgi:hypothetical protein
MNQLGSTPAKGVNGCCAGDRFTASQRPLGNEVFLSSLGGDTSAVDDQRVAALHDHRIFVAIVHIGVETAVFRQLENAI